MRRLDIDGVTTTTAEVGGTTRAFLTIEPHVFAALAREVFQEISHFLRSDHLASLRGILDDRPAEERGRLRR
jgi:fumarate hydratase class I